MIYKEKFVSGEIISKLPNWIIHFLWYLLEDCVQNDADFDGYFTLRRIPEGQHIACTVNGRPFEVDMPCPSSVDAAVQIVHETERLVMRISGETQPAE